MKKYLFFATVVFSLFIASPKSELYSGEPIALDLGGYMIPEYFGVAANAENKYAMTLYVEDYSAYNGSRFALVTVCTPYDINNWYVTNSGKVNSYFDEFFDTFDTGKRCYMGDNVRGTLRFLQFYIGKPKTIEGTNEIRVSSYLHLKNIYDYNVRYDFLQVQLSDEDYLAPLINQSVSSQKQQEIIDKLTQNIQGINDLKNKQDQTNSKLDDLNSKQDQTNSKLDNIKDMDAPDSAKTKPDDSDYQDYEKAQGDLTDKISDIPTDTLEIGIDANSSNFIFDTMNKLINAHPAVFSMFIAILSIGIIKLGLGR